MYFKSIEMSGFKSFADHTVVRLEPGVTAIVGPNGCGKSNILDGMRWALGEQSAKALRGSHMQDVIFNGSEHRPATGMAEVTLCFDNADSKLPLDFAEVQITRRVYRSGESEYMINKAPCRLRDIQELFMDTGIGTSAYSLIGQGKIDLVLSSKPEDRRYLFEEAAGIIKYKTRKRVAMRKLDSAEQNLLRLGDIVAEVQRQMRNLKRQVNAAIRHRELTAALKDLEVRNSWLRFNELSGQIADLRMHFKKSQDAYEKASAKTSTHEAELEEINLRRVELDRTLMARRDGEHEIDTEMERIESTIALLRKEIDFRGAQHEQALRDRDALAERATEILNRRDVEAEQTRTLQAEIEAVQSGLTADQVAFAQAQQAVNEAEQRLEEVRSAALESVNTRSRTESELESIQAGLDATDKNLASVYARQEDQASRHEELSLALGSRRTELAQKGESLRETAEAKQGALEREKVARAELDKLNTAWQDARESKSSREARLHSLRELRDSYEGFAAGVRAVMVAKQQGIPEAKGLIGPVGDLISTGKEHELAIEAALGGNINNVVVERAEAAKSAIEFLKRNQAGRVTFLPLDTIRSSSHDDTDSIAGKPGVIGRAIDYVRCEERYLPAVQYLLYNTVIVETIDHAIHIARGERRFPRLVTLEGEVVSSAGAVTGGRTKHESRGLLGRSAEIEELERSVAESAKQIAALAKEGQQITDALQKLGTEIRTLSATEEALRKAVGELEVGTARHAAELEGASQGVQDLAKQRDELLRQREALEERRKAVQDRIVSLEGDNADLQRRTADAQEAASQAREALSKQSDRLADLRVKLAGSTQSLEEAERNRQRDEREHAAAIEECRQREEFAKKRLEEQAEFESKIKDHIERTKALSESKDEAHAKVLEAQREQQKAIAAVDGLSKKLKALRDESAVSQKEVHRLELELSHKEDRVAFFQERILEEYGLALSALKEEEVGTDEHDEEEREKLIAEHRKSLQRLGSVNLMAIEEYETLEQRDVFLRTQEEDLRKARETLLSVVERIDKTITEMFLETFRTVSDNFKNYFRQLFSGGQARIYLLDEDDPLESGIEIEARPPGKKPQTISLLSGGEQAMTAIALLFSIFSAKPSPFCVLDEVDAPLDDANIGRFLNLVDEFTSGSQFIIITHNKQTMGRADAIFGVTQQERGVSQLVSVKFDEVQDTSDAA